MKAVHQDFATDVPPSFSFCMDSLERPLLLMKGSIQLIENLQKHIVRWDILHRSAIMGIADVTIFIYNATQRHTSQLEKIHFLFIQSGNPMIGIRQSNKGDFFIRPILLEGCW